MKYFIVDGNYLLWRNVHKLKHLTNSDGFSTGPTFGFLKSLHKYLEFGEPIVVFDGGRAKWREELYPEYKKRIKSPKVEGEEDTSKYFDCAFQILEELLPKMGIPTIKMAGQEADDVIFRLGQNIFNNGNKVTVISDDEDYLQMVSHGMEVFRAMKDEYYTLNNFSNYKEVSPNQFIFWKCLMGDDSDNISGIKGIGPVAATKIIKQLPDKQTSFFDIVGLINKDKLEDKNLIKLKENFNIFKRNLELMDLSRCKISNTEVQTAYIESQLQSKPDFDFVVNKFKQLEFRTISLWFIFVSEKLNNVRK
jgi:DNA polymerase-1